MWINVFANDVSIGLGFEPKHSQAHFCYHFSNFFTSQKSLNDYYFDKHDRCSYSSIASGFYFSKAKT